MLMQNHIAGFGVSGGGFTVNAVDYDGTNDYLNRGAALTGVSDSSQGIFSAWIRHDVSQSGSTVVLFHDNVGTVRIERDSSNKLAVVMTNNGGTQVLSFRTTNSYDGPLGWLHFLASWDTNFSAGNKKSHIYINSSSDKTVVSDTAAAFNIDYTQTDFYVAGRTIFSKLNGCLAEVYFAPGQFLDFSIQANREKFILGGKPVDLGTTGSLPTGTAPSVYLKNPAASVGTNSGTGGNFTINGAPTVASTSPSD